MQSPTIMSLRCMPSGKGLENWGSDADAQAKNGSDKGHSVAAGVDETTYTTAAVPTPQPAPPTPATLPPSVLSSFLSSPPFRRAISCQTPGATAAPQEIVSWLLYRVDTALCCCVAEIPVVAGGMPRPPWIRRSVEVGEQVSSSEAAGRHHRGARLSYPSSDSLSDRALLRGLPALGGLAEMPRSSSSRGKEEEEPANDNSVQCGGGKADATAARGRLTVLLSAAYGEPVAAAFAHALTVLNDGLRRAITASKEAQAERRAERRIGRAERRIGGG